MRKIVTLFVISTLTAYSMASFANDNTTITQSALTPIAKPVAEEPAPSPLSGNFDITTNYIFRGISQSNNLPAAQGGFTYTFLKTGIYANIWGSNVNFPDPQGNTATFELDTIVGVANSITDHLSYNVNFNRYNYPKSASSYNEGIANLTYYFLTAQVAYSSNVYNLHGNGIYYNLTASYDIPAEYIHNIENVNVKAGIGHYNLQNNIGLRSYNDYLVQINKTIGCYNIALQWTDTNRDSVDATAIKGNQFVGTVTVNF